MLKHMNDAISYIEDNLTETIDFCKVAKIALCSEYHFKRMFSFLTGISLSGYIRKRRLSLAALQLIAKPKMRILDVAILYGYTSADAFTRAFQKQHGISPSELQEQPNAITIYPRMTFQLTIQGGDKMHVRIVEKDAFTIIGIKKRIPIQFDGINPEIAKMWESLTQEKIADLKRLSTIEPLGLISASTNFTEGRMEEKGELDHYIGVATDNIAPSNWDTLAVAPTTWAVFEAIGPFPTTLQQIWGRIYSEWFPSTDYEQAEGPEILWNESKDTSSPQYRSEIWIPVKHSSKG